MHAGAATGAADELYELVRTRRPSQWQDSERARVDELVEAVVSQNAPWPRTGLLGKWRLAYLQPGPPKPGQKDEPGLAGVGIEHAFSSPQTLSNCSEFLRKHIGETGSQSAMIVVRKNHVQYPCVWKGKEKGKWPADEKKDGILMQLEARGARAVFFTEITKAGGGFSVGETHQLDAEEFAIFPRLFK